MVPGNPHRGGVPAESQNSATFQVNERILVVFDLELTQTEQSPGVCLLRFERNRLL